MSKADLGEVMVSKTADSALCTVKVRNNFDVMSDVSSHGINSCQWLRTIWRGCVTAWLRVI